MSQLEATVQAFLAAEEARDLLRKRNARDRKALREALEMADALPHNDGSRRLKTWALERYNG